MEVDIRGLIEKDIDSLIESATIDRLVVWFKEMFPIGSLEDSLFGFIVGAVFARFLGLLEERGRKPTNAEVKEFMELIERRAMEIKGKIKLALNK